MASSIEESVAEMVTLSPNDTAAGSSRFASRFGWEDYLVFSFMLTISAVIGLYYAFINRNKKECAEEFLLAGKSMTTFPISMSLIASFVSAISLLGTPSDVYQNGFIYWLIIISYFLVMPATSYLYLPVFWDLQVTSSYEYLERRFHRKARQLGSFIFIVQMTLYMAIVVYAPSLALSQVTGINLYLSISLICFVCMFYTTLGGMKAVLWTDTLQVIVIYITMVVIIVYGSLDVGGFGYVWQKALDSGRAELYNFDPDPTNRHTFWSLIIGGYFTWITNYGCNQAQVQRYLCVRKLYMARRALWINAFGLAFIMILCSFAGLVIYAKYHDCDPTTSGIVQANDQLFPYFVLDTMGDFKGLPGLFVAGIFAGALSTVSTGMNSLAAIVLEDFLKDGCWPTITAHQAGVASKGLSIAFGVLTFALVFVAERLGNVLAAALSIFGMVGGPLLGMFTLGMFFPWANSKGCIIGTLCSLAICFWIGVGQNIARSLGYYVIVPKMTSTVGCGFNVIKPVMKAVFDNLDEDSIWNWEVYKISYLWFSCIGCFTVIIIGLIVTFITGKQNVRTLNPKTLSPGLLYFRRFIPGLDGLGEDFKDDSVPLEVVQSRTDLGEVNFAFDATDDKRSDVMEVVEASKL